MTADGIGWDPERGELWFAGETAEAVLLELDGAPPRAARRGRGARSPRDRGGDRAREQAAEQAPRAAERFAPVAHLRNVRRADAVAARPHRRRAPNGSTRPCGSRRPPPAGSRRRSPSGPAASPRTCAGSPRARPSFAARSPRPTRARSPPSAARAAARPTRSPASSPSCGSRPKSSRRVRSRRPRQPRRPPSARGARPARSPTPTRPRAAGRASSCWSGSPAAPSGSSARSRSTSSASRLRSAAGRRRRRPAPPSSAPRCGASAPRRSSCGRRRRRPASGSRRSTSSSRGPTPSATRRSVASTPPQPSRPRATTATSSPRRLARYEKRREQLGQVNPLAKEEYDAEKERLEELSVQRADLEKSLDELEKLRDELTKTVETRFAETFAAVEQHFHEVAATLFPGGEGRLRMTEPEDEGEEPGIEVELRPAGKRVTRLSLLSGGEKALGAIAFLFSLFLARPSPFYLLDEVEAALDDTNIGRFTELLRTYADRAQFIVITHQKRTMEAADVLYGVTMGTDGVSQIVSRRLPREDEVAATA